VRKPANFISSISDDRGYELRYAGMKISEIFSEDLGVGGVLSLLWFRRRLPAYATKFIEMVLMVTADHGPAVSGAHNTIVTARAGKVGKAIHKAHTNSAMHSSVQSSPPAAVPRAAGSIQNGAHTPSVAVRNLLSPHLLLLLLRISWT
jgi:citrate synthase